MKRFLFLAVVLMATASMSFGQIAYKQGDQVITGGLGLGSVAGAYGDVTIPPISASYEMGYNENISIGGLVGISGSEQAYNLGFFGSWKYKYTYIIIGARGAYHYDLMKNEKIDTYGGIMIGYNIVSASTEGTALGTYSVGGSYLAYGGYAGIRYYFSPNLAAYGEIGYGLGIINVGIAYKM
jgi:hypothetical protein